jgi:hypothetical protein
MGFIDHRRNGTFFEGGADLIMAVRIESFDGEK